MLFYFWYNYLGLSIIRTLHETQQWIRFPYPATEVKITQSGYDTIQKNIEFETECVKKGCTFPSVTQQHYHFFLLFFFTLHFLFSKFLFSAPFLLQKKKVFFFLWGGGEGVCFLWDKNRQFLELGDVKHLSKTTSRVLRGSNQPHFGRLSAKIGQNHTIEILKILHFKAFSGTCFFKIRVWSKIAQKWLKMILPSFFSS